MLLAQKSIQISKMIWNMLIQYKNNTNIIRAEFAPNAQASVKTCDSTLFYYLKQTEWLPNCQGQFFKPADIALEELHPEFQYDVTNKLLLALGIGSTAMVAEKEKERLDQQIFRVYGFDITDEDQKYFLENKDEIKRLIETKLRERYVPSISSQELFRQQNKLANTHIQQKSNESKEYANKEDAKRKIEETFKNAHKMKPMVRKIFASVSKSSLQERDRLHKWYQGKCQICGTHITKHDQMPYFVARNIINTRDLTNELLGTLDLCWNSLCLCPNCAAKYLVCSKDISGLYDQILNHNANCTNEEIIVLTIELDGKQQYLHYIPQHFLALQQAIILIDKNIGL